MASPKTIAANERAKKVLAASLAKFSEERGLVPVHRTSRRWLGRTKGLPFSRMKLVDFQAPPQKGMQGNLVLEHPTKGRVRVVRATPEILSIFMPSIPPYLRAVMMGV